MCIRDRVGLVRRGDEPGEHEVVQLGAQVGEARVRRAALDCPQDRLVAPQDASGDGDHLLHAVRDVGPDHLYDCLLYTSRCV